MPALKPTDITAIHDLIVSYAHYCDSADFGAAATLFAAAEVYLPFERFSCDPAGMEAMWRRWVRVYPDTGTPKTLHLVSNIVVTAQSDSPRIAAATSYCLVMQGTDALPLQPIIGVINRDRFARVDCGWQFCERRQSTVFTGDLGEHLLLPVDNHASS